MSEAVIRHATSADLTDVLALYRQLNPGDPFVDLATAEPVWAALLTSGLTTVFVADVGGRAVACCTLAIVPNLSRGARPYAVIENVVTDADHRQMGLGRAILHAACSKAWEANCYKVLLATGSTKEETLRFYEGAGFTRNSKTYFEIRQH